MTARNAETLETQADVHDTHRHPSQHPTNVPKRRHTHSAQSPSISEHKAMCGHPPRTPRVGTHRHVQSLAIHVPQDTEQLLPDADTASTAFPLESVVSLHCPLPS